MNDDEAPGSDRRSIVDLRYVQAHKLLTEAERDAVFADIGSGALKTPAQLALRAAGNSLASQATPLPYGPGWTEDTLFDEQDQQYWALTVPKDQRLQIWVSLPSGSVAPKLSLGRLSGGQFVGVPGPAPLIIAKSQSVNLYQDVKAGDYLVRVQAGIGTSVVPIVIKAYEAPPPELPTNCSGFVNCYGHVWVQCDQLEETLVLQRVTATRFGSTYVDVDVDEFRTRPYVALQDVAPPAARSANYRVCARSYSDDSCTEPFSVSLGHKECFEQFDCANQPLFSCFDTGAELEEFCCTERPSIPELIPIPRFSPIGM